MKKVQIGSMLSLSKEKSEKLGEFVLLQVSDDKKSTPFVDELTTWNVDDDDEMFLTGASIMMTKTTAKKLGLQLLKLAEGK